MTPAQKQFSLNRGATRKQFPISISSLTAPSKIVVTVFLIGFMFSTVDRLSGDDVSRAVNVRAWGRNANGQCNVPQTLTNAVAIAAGQKHSIALTAVGSVVAWGDNSFGQGNVPTDATNVIAIAAGSLHSMALCDDGKVLAWGYNLNGECNVPKQLADVVAIAAGTECSVALRSDGTVVVWGRGDTGLRDVPHDLTNAVAVSAGQLVNVAATSSGAVRAWGGDNFGEISRLPPGLQDALVVATGTFHCMTLRADTSVVAWGWNELGQCDVPIGLTNTVAIAAGVYHSVALTADGGIVTWGSNDEGQLDVPGNLPFVTAISAKYKHNLALINFFPPRVLRSPETRTVSISSTVHLSVSVIGSTPLRYQWYFGTNSIPGAHQAWLTLPDVQPSDAGVYSVVVTNVAGSATSSLASLRVLPGLRVDMVPTVTVKGEIGASYRLDYVNIIGPTNNWAYLATVSVTNNSQLYFDLSGAGRPARFYRLSPSP